MAEIKIVNTRLKDGEELYSKTRIKSSIDIFNMFRDDFEKMPNDTLGVININSYGQVINMQFATEKEFPQKARLFYAGAVISNAASVVVVSNCLPDDEVKKLTATFAREGELIGIPMIDHVCEMNSYIATSFRQHDLIDESYYDANLFNKDARIDFSDETLSALTRLCLNTDKTLNVERADKNTAIKIVTEELRLSDREMFCIINLDENSEVLNIYYASIGDINSTIIHPREAFKASILSNAAEVVLLHNHPSGNNAPSQADKATTRKLLDAGRIFGIELSEHYIVAGMSGELRPILEESRFSYLEVSTDYVKENCREYSTQNIRYFIDMDGTLAEFKSVDTLETLYQKGYFYNLKPQQPVIDAVKSLAVKEPENVYILSSHLSDSKYALEEKNAWLDEHLPEVPKEHRLFPPCGVSKLAWLEQRGYEITKQDILLDDYSKNLHEWEEKGTGLKLLNGINHTKGTWQKATLNMDELASKGLSAREAEPEQPKFSPTNISDWTKKPEVRKAVIDVYKQHNETDFLMNK